MTRSHKVLVFIPPFLIVFTFLMTLFAIQHNAVQSERAIEQSERMYEVTSPVPAIPDARPTPGQPLESPQEVVCTADVRECPDGSYVNRIAPDCVFATCPIASNPTSTDSVAASSSGDTVFCTMEVKECSDGSYVGRSGPNCQFDPCPDELSLIEATVQ